MKYNRMTIFLIPMFLFGFLSSCSIDFSNEEFLKNDFPLTLVIRDSDYNEIKRTEILTDSPKYNQLKNWLIKNSKGWRKSPVSYIAKISITSKNYGLLIIKRGVVITYKDKEGKQIQIDKKFDESELDFLLE